RTLDVQLLIGGVTLGCVYALITAGFVLVYRGTRLLNFAHPAFCLIGAYVAWQIFTSMGLGYFGSMLLSALVTGALSWLVQWGMFSRLMGRPLFSLFMLTLGLEVVIVTAIEGYRPWSLTPKEVLTPWRTAVVTLFG